MYVHMHIQEKEPLDFEKTKEEFEKLTYIINEYNKDNSGIVYTTDDVAYGFIRVSILYMCIIYCVCV